jgi:hypothetical protein
MQLCFAMFVHLRFRNWIETLDAWSLELGMDSDRIRTDTKSDVTIYHILFQIWIRIRIRILSNTNTKRIFRIRIHIRIMSINFICRWFYNWSYHVTSRE